METLLFLFTLPFILSFEFNYENTSHWGFSCGGKSQSPINIVTENVLHSFAPNLQSTTPPNDQPASMELRPTVIEVTPFSQTSFLSGSTLFRDYFYFLQFHFHSPSEHSINGKKYDLEIHYVHQSRSGSFAVMGVLYQIGEENDDLHNIIANLGVLQNDGDTVDMVTPILYPTYGSSFWHYSGSLTAPPCTEGVNWFVSQTILTLSQSQLSALKSKLNNGESNNRPTQPLNNRQIYQFVPSTQYNYANPSSWGDLWPLCSGIQQSPINIDTNLVDWDVTISPLSFDFNDEPQVEELANTGSTIEVSFSSPTSQGVNVSGAVLFHEKFRLNQFHFHSPSEHTINGDVFGLEIHFVYSSQNNPMGRLSVIAYLFSLSNVCNEFLSPIVDALPFVNNFGDTAEIEISFPFNDLSAENYWHYIGSLTTPPCTEIVNWFVYRETLPICDTQLTSIIDAIDFYPNNRPVQLNNGRFVYAIGSSVATRIQISSFVLFIFCLTFFF
jgi:carbonic anhydrase